MSLNAKSRKRGPFIHPFNSSHSQDLDNRAVDGLASGGDIEYEFLLYYVFVFSIDLSAMHSIIHSAMGY